MARINVGVNPQYLSDQHLIAESVEITMIPGHLKRYDWEMKTPAPNTFRLGKGHINFFKPKLRYLQRRLQAVNLEMERRGFKPGTSMDDVMEQAPNKYKNDWQPTLEATKMIRARIVDRLRTRTNGKPGKNFHRYKRSNIQNLDLFINKLNDSKLYKV